MDRKILVLLAFVSIIMTAGAYSQTIGGYGNSDGYVGGAVITSSKMTITGTTANFVDISINMYASDGSNLWMGIYADSSGSPGAKLCTSSSQAGSVGWVDFNVLSCNLPATNGNSYWLALESTNGAANYPSETSGGTICHHSQTQGVFPDPYGGGCETWFTEYFAATYGTTTTSTTSTSTSTSVTTTSINPIVATPNPFTVSNSVINTAGQISMANTIISGGALTTFSGQFTLIGGNMIPVSLSTGTIQFGPHGGVGSIGGVMLPNGKQFYVTDYLGGSVNVIDVASNTAVALIMVGPNPEGIAATPSSKQLYVSCSGVGCTTVNVIDVNSNTVVATIAGFSRVQDVAITPNGKEAIATNFGSNSIGIIDVASNTLVKTVSLSTDANVKPYHLSISPSGKQAYIGDDHSGSGTTVYVFDIPSNTVVNTITGFNNPYDVACTPSGKELWVIDHMNNQVSVVDVASNSIVNTITIGGTTDRGNGFGFASKLKFTPTGTMAYVVDHNHGNVITLDVAANTIISTLSMVTLPRDILITPSGTTLYTINYDSSVDTVNIINIKSTTSFLPLSATTNVMTMKISATSTNTIQLVFGGLTTLLQTGANTIYGSWTIKAGLMDNGTNPLYYGSQLLTISNTITFSDGSSTTTSTSTSTSTSTTVSTSTSTSTSTTSSTSTSTSTTSTTSTSSTSTSTSTIPASTTTVVTTAMTTMAIADLALPTNVNDTAGLLGWANTAVGGNFGIGIDVALFIIILIGAFLATGSIEVGLIFGGSICTVVALGLQGLGIAPSYLMFVFMGVAALGFVLAMTRKSGSIY